MFTWGHVYSTLDRHNDIERDLQQIHLAELATGQKPRAARRAPAYFAIVSGAAAGLAHLLLGLARFGTLRH